MTTKKVARKAAPKAVRTRTKQAGAADKQGTSGKRSSPQKPGKGPTQASATTTAATIGSLTWLDVAKEELLALGGDDLERLGVRLIRAELHARGGDPSAVLAKLEATIADGGIDAIVPVAPKGSTYVPEGQSTWHFTKKRMGGAAFEAWVREQLAATSVKEKRRQGAATVLVTTRDVDADRLVRLERSQRRLRIITSERLQAWLANHVGISLSFRDTAPLQWLQPAMSSARASYEFIWDTDRRQARERIRAIIHHASASHELRLEGPTGVGKTRLLLESMATTPGAAERVLYSVDSAPGVGQPAAQFILWVTADKQRSAVLVLDECDHAGHQYWTAFARDCGERLKLITIGPTAALEPVEESPDVVPVTALAEQDVLRFLQSNFGLHGETAQLVVGACKGFIKAAEVLGRYLQRNPDDARPRTLAALIEKEAVFRRALGDAGHAVQMVAVFTDLGWEGQSAAELKGVAEHHGQNPAALRQKLRPARAQGLLQPTRTNRAYVTPRVLADSLALLAARDGASPLADLFFSVPHLARVAMLERFIPLKDDLHVLAVLSEIANRLGRPPGGSGQGPTVEEAGYMRSLAGAVAREVLAAIQSRLASLSTADLRDATSSRRDIVWALERIVADPAHFDEAADLLLTLATAENEPYGNNATGVWLGLFGTGLAGTQANNDHRLRVLKDAARAPSAGRRALGARAAAWMLSEGHHHAVYSWLNPERPDDSPALPELHQNAWRVLIDLLDDSDEAVRYEAAQGARRGFLQALRMVPGAALEALDRAAKGSENTRLAAFAAADEALPVLSKHLAPELRARFMAALAELEGKGFRERLLRCAGERLRSHWSEESQSRLVQESQSLGREALAHPQILLAELPWLSSSAAERAFDFTRELGRLDKEHRFLRPLEDLAEQGRGVLALAGYAVGLATWDEPAVESVLDEWAGRSGSFAQATFEATFQLGASDVHLRRMLAIVRRGDVPASALQSLLYGSWAAKLPGDVVQEVIDLVREVRDPQASSTAIEIVNRWRELHREESDAGDRFDDQVLEFLTSAAESASGMGTYSWSKVAERVRDRAPVRIAMAILQALPDDRISRADRELAPILLEACRRAPELVWPLIGERLLRDYGLVLSLAGQLDGLPVALLIEWAGKHAPQAPAVLARMATVSGVSIPGLAAALLQQFGPARSVREILSAQHLSGSYRGSGSDDGEPYWEFLSRRRAEAQGWTSSSIPAVSGWAREQARRIDERLTAMSADAAVTHP